jgi:hypothetical protein
MEGSKDCLNGTPRHSLLSPSNICEITEERETQNPGLQMTRSAAEDSFHGEVATLSASFASENENQGDEDQELIQVTGPPRV